MATAGNFTKNTTVSEVLRLVYSQLGIGAAPAAFVGSTDLTVSQLVDMLTSVGQDLCLMHDWQELHKEFTVTTASGTTEYALPTDFNGFVNDTSWNNTTRLPALGSLTPQIWRMIKARNLGGNLLTVQYRIVGNLITLYYAPSTAQTIMFDYYSRGWLQDNTTSPATYRDNVQYDSDTVLFDPRIITSYLKLRWRAAKGFNTTEVTKEFNEAWDLVTGRDVPAMTLSVGRGMRTGLLDYYNIPDTNYGT